MSDRTDRYQRVFLRLAETMSETAAGREALRAALHEIHLHVARTDARWQKARVAGGWQRGAASTADAAGAGVEGICARPFPSSGK